MSRRKRVMAPGLYFNYSINRQARCFAIEKTGIRVAKGSISVSPRKAAQRTAKTARAIGRPMGKRGIGKEMLIEKTAELLRTVPPEKLSLSSAARHAHVHLTLFKYYFQDRTRLLVDVARTLSKGLGDHVAEIERDAKSAPER